MIHDETRADLIAPRQKLPENRPPSLPLGDVTGLAGMALDMGLIQNARSKACRALRRFVRSLWHQELCRG